MAKKTELDFPLTGTDIAFLTPIKQAEMRNLRLIGRVVPDADTRESRSLAEKLRWQRRRVDTGLSHSRRVTDGYQAAHLVQEAGFVIGHGYMTTRAHEVAAGSHYDALGNAYQLLPEMYRDYHYERLRVADLTGKQGLKHAALLAIDSAIKFAIPETGVDHLARMERELLQKDRGEDLDFNKLTNAFKGVRRNFNIDVGPERLAMAAYWFARESYERDQPEAGRAGIRALRVAIPSIPQRFKFVIKNMFKDIVRPSIFEAQRKSAPDLLAADFPVI